MPLVYALFTNKEQATYQKFFEFLNSKVLNKSSSVSSDFEIGITNAIENVFPDTDSYGCFFHLKKPIWRKIQENGISRQYCDFKDDDNQIRLYSKILASLAFVPQEDVEDAFVLAQANAPKELKKVYAYLKQIILVINVRPKCLVEKGQGSQLIVIVMNVQKL